MRRWILPLIGCLMVSPVFAQQAASKFKAGAATSNITPPLGGGIVGGFAPIPSEHIHDELHARCLVLDDGSTKLALVVCDLLGINRSVSDEARKLIKESVGIPPERVLISATHTHSALSALGNRFSTTGELDDYQKFVVKRIADGVKTAANNLRPAEIGFGTVEAPEHVFNRRWFMRAGTVPPNPFGTIDMVKMNPPAGSPNLTEPAGPIDPVISFIAVREPKGRPIGLYAAYSLHYVGGVGKGHVSADYFGMFSERLKELVQVESQDPPFVAMMANGTSGDINNINFRNPRPGQPAYTQMRYVAHDVAQKVSDSLAKIEYRSDATLDARYREPVIGTRRVDKELMAWAEKTKAASEKEKSKGSVGKVDLSAIYADRTISMASLPETMPMPLQVLRIGDVSIGTMPCEVFCEIGLEFKQRSPIRPAFLVSLSHGYYGYLPTPRQHEYGGYETWMGTNRLEKEASVKMLNNLVEMAAEMKK